LDESETTPELAVAKAYTRVESPPTVLIRLGFAVSIEEWALVIAGLLI